MALKAAYSNDFLLPKTINSESKRAIKSLFDILLPPRKSCIIWMAPNLFSVIKGKCRKGLYIFW